ncbi:hypothetical protein KO502_05445 [Colwellia sp. E2M01]|nr:hypothetical protein [Colwellia sp. E2M01]
MHNLQVLFFARLFFKVVLFLLFMMNDVKANHSLEHISLSNQVQQLLTVSDEKVPAETVNLLADKIFENSDHYSNDVIAKISFLSAVVASNRGNINNVLFFAERGLAANCVDKRINVSLLLKLAEVYVAEKQYTQLLDLTKKVIEESMFIANVKYNLIALSYRSVAFSMLGQHKQALENLQKVEQGIDNSELSEQIELLTILALAYHNLRDYQTSLTMQLKILKLRFELNQKNNIDQTYLYLGYAYFYLQRFDDAYNAFWEAKQSAELKFAPINVAQAEKGLGVVLLTQKNYRASLLHLQKANEVFLKYNMLVPHIESSVALAKAKLSTNEKSEAYALLTEVIVRLAGTDISLEYSGFYRMVAEMYFAQQEYQIAYQWLDKYSQVTLAKFNSNKKTANLLTSMPRNKMNDIDNSSPRQESKRLAVKLAETSELSGSFVGKYNKQRLLIISLSISVVVLFIVLIISFIRLRAQKVNLAYDEAERPSYIMHNPTQTKFHYQSSFKKARNFRYPLGVGYLTIDNWQELTFHFNQKIIKEVIKEISSVINQQIDEFDYAGLLSENEFLLLFEYQNNQAVDEKLKKIAQAINTRSFASLGEFSIVIKFSLNTPGFKDIDPYLFLGSVTEVLKNEQLNQPKTS